MIFLRKQFFQIKAQEDEINFQSLTKPWREINALATFSEF